MATTIRRLNQHLGPLGQTRAVYSGAAFCGACGRLIDKTYDAVRTIDQQRERDDAGDWYPRYPASDDHEQIRFCPWCGVELAETLGPIENERSPDHLNEPGMHPGDSHVMDMDDEHQHAV